MLISNLLTKIFSDFKHIFKVRFRSRFKNTDLVFQKSFQNPLHDLAYDYLYIWYAGCPYNFFVSFLAQKRQFRPLFLEKSSLKNYNSSYDIMAKSS